MEYAKSFLKYSLAIGGVASISYFLYKYIFDENNKEIILSDYLNEYIFEAREKLLNSRDFNLDLACFILGLYDELEHYLFEYRHSDLTEQRIDFLKANYKKEYEALLITSISLHDDTFSLAEKILDERVQKGINATLTQYLTSSGFSSEVISETRRRVKKKKNLKEFKPNEESKNKVREMYAAYTELNKEREKIANDLFEMANKNNQYMKLSVSSYAFNKYFVRDKIKADYGFDFNDFDDLISANELDEDEKIKACRKINDSIMY